MAYHVNPATGVSGECRARTGKCPYGGEDKHYTSVEAARTAFEKFQERVLDAELTIKKFQKTLVRNEDLDFDLVAFNLQRALDWEEPWTDADLANMETIVKLADVVERAPFRKKDQQEAERLVKQLIPAKIYPKAKGGWSTNDTTWRARDKMLNSLGESLLKRRIFDHMVYDPAEPLGNDRLLGYEETRDAFLEATNHPPYDTYKGARFGPVEPYFKEAIARVVRGDTPIDPEHTDDHASLLPPAERIFNALHPESPLFENKLYMTSVFPVRELKDEMERTGLDGVTVTPFYNGREWGNVYTVIEPDGATRSFAVYEHRNTDSIIINGRKNWKGQGELPYTADSKDEFFAEFGPQDHKRAASALVFFMTRAKQGELDRDKHLAAGAPRRDWEAILSEAIPGFKEWSEKNFGPRVEAKTPEDVLRSLDFPTSSD